MTTLIVELSDALVHRHLEAAMAAGVSLDEHLEQVLAKEAAPPGAASIGWEEAVAIAMTRAKDWEKAKGDFIVQDLFSAEEWTTVESPRWVGRRFGELVEKERVATRCGTTPGNKAVYRRA